MLAVVGDRFAAIEKAFWGEMNLLGMYGFDRDQCYTEALTSRTEGDFRLAMKDDYALKAIIAVGEKAARLFFPDRFVYGSAVIVDGRLVLPVPHPADGELGEIIEHLGQVEGLLAGAEEVVNLAEEVKLVVFGWPPNISFLVREEKPAPKTAKCQYCRATETLSRYVGRGLKWILCMPDAIKIEQWAKDNGVAMEHHESSQAAHDEKMRRMDAAAKMQKQLTMAF